MDLEFGVALGSNSNILLLGQNETSQLEFSKFRLSWVLSKYDFLFISSKCQFTIYDFDWETTKLAT